MEITGQMEIVDNSSFYGTCVRHAKTSVHISDSIPTDLHGAQTKAQKYSIVSHHSYLG